MDYVFLGIVTSVFALLALTLVKRVFSHPIARYQSENDNFEDE